MSTTTPQQPAATPRTLTFRYRIFQYEDGEGSPVFQVQRQGFLGMFWWVRNKYHIDNPPRQWDVRELAVLFCRNDAEDRRNKIDQKRRAELQSKLKLITSWEEEL